MIGVMGGRIIISGVNYVLRQWTIIKLLTAIKIFMYYYHENDL